MSRASHAPYLPYLHRPPHDPRRLPLGPVPGWRVQALDQLSLDPEGALTLARLPASRPALNSPDGTLGSRVLPPNMAWCPATGLLLLDGPAAQLKRFDGCDCRFLTLPCTGGMGLGPRQLRDPGGLALCGHNLLIADAGNARVVVYGLHGWTPRGFWSPPAGATPQPWRPVDLVIWRRQVLVADPNNGAIHRFNRGGRWLGLISHLGALSRLALDGEGRLYGVLDDQQPVLVLDPTSGEILARSWYADQAPGDFPAQPFRQAPGGLLDLSPLCAADAGPAWFDAKGNPAEPPVDSGEPTHYGNGSYLSEVLDSRLYRCQWDRLALRAEMPPGGRVQVWTHSAETPLTRAQLDRLPERAWSTGQTLVPAESGEQDWDCLLRAEPGRYLWLRLVLSGDGRGSPRIQQVHLDFPRISLRRYLPAVFGEEPQTADLTDRLLSIFDRGLRQVEGQVDRQARLFDPLSAPAEAGKGDFLTWLAGWIGVTLDRQLPLDRRRALVKQAGKLFACRGTLVGLRRMLELTLGLAEHRCAPAADCGPCTRCQAPAWRPPELILEHYRLRRWLFLGSGRLGEQARLWGQSIVGRSQLSGPATGGNARLGVTRLDTTQDPYRDPFHVYAHRFTLFLPGPLAANPSLTRAIERLVAAEKPAHTSHQIRYVQPRMRIGVQAMIGLDAVVGRWPGGVTLDGNRLGKATVLGGRDGSERTRRVGVSTRLSP